MPVLPGLLERGVMRAGLAPPFLTDVVNAAALRAYGVARRLGVFDRLARGPATVADLAAATETDPVSLEHLLGLLERTGYVQRAGPRFRASRMVEQWLAPGGPRAIPSFLEHWHNVLFEHFASLEDAVRVGAPQPHLHEWLASSGRWPVFNAAMAELAATSADAVADAAELPASYGTLADLGGSHGLNALAFCRRYPGLTATVIDLPEALAAGLAEGQMGGRVSFRAGDILHDELGGPYDVILVFQLLHYFSPTTNGELLGRARRALRPGGRLLIFDQLRGAAPTPLASAFFALLALTYRASLGGDLYDHAAIRAWLIEAGFRNVRRRWVRTAPGNALISAEA